MRDVFNPVGVVSLSRADTTPSGLTAFCPFPRRRPVAPANAGLDDEIPSGYLASHPRRRPPKPHARRAGIPQPRPTAWAYGVQPSRGLKGHDIRPFQGRAIHRGDAFPGRWPGLRDDAPLALHSGRSRNASVLAGGFGRRLAARAAGQVRPATKFHRAGTPGEPAGEDACATLRKAAAVVADAPLRSISPGR